MSEKVNLLNSFLLQYDLEQLDESFSEVIIDPVARKELVMNDKLFLTVTDLDKTPKDIIKKGSEHWLAYETLAIFAIIRGDLRNKKPEAYKEVISRLVKDLFRAKDADMVNSYNLVIYLTRLLLSYKDVPGKEYWMAAFYEFLFRNVYWTHIKGWEYNRSRASVREKMEDYFYELSPKKKKELIESLEKTEYHCREKLTEILAWKQKETNGRGIFEIVILILLLIIVAGILAVLVILVNDVDSGDVQGAPPAAEEETFEEVEDTDEAKEASEDKVNQ